MEDGFWGLGERTPNRRALRQNDEIVFYVGNPEKAFKGTASLSSDVFMLTPDQLETFGHGKEFYRPEYGVFLSDIDVWQKPRRMEEVLADIQFIVNKDDWYAYFQGGVRQVSEQDFYAITASREIGLVEQVKAARDIESESEFFLESHLEEFIDKNWPAINFHADLVRYRAEDQDGRQFPAGPWSIDFLCLDQRTNELVVLELKRGKSSDAAVGQILRYISWVQENLAASAQGVRGIIVAHSADDALRYAVKATPNVRVLTYKVSFGLSPI